MLFKNRVSSRGSLAGKVMLLLVAVLMLFTPAVFADTVIDFGQTNGYGTDADTVMIENIRVDMETINPFDPTHPTIVPIYYNVPFVFDYTTLHLIPDLGGSTEISDATSCADLLITVTDAYTGDPISGASVTIGNSTQTTGVNGTANFSNLVSGSSQVNAVASGYVSDSSPLTLTCESDNVVVLALNPEEGEGALQAGEARVVLTWGQNPSDLDSHLTGPNASSNGSLTDTSNRFHIYYSHKTEDVAVLDVDDTSSYGPETVTITPPAGSSSLRPGLYRYSVHHYSGSSDISNSGAVVKLYFGDQVYNTFSPPSGSFGDDCVWTVFELAVDSSGAVTLYTINTYTDDLSPSAITRTGYGSVETGVDFSSLPRK